MTGFVIDFGSTNTGASYVVGTGGYAQPIFVYNNGGYPKEPTEFYVKKEVLNLDNIENVELRVCSSLQPETQNPNFIWTRAAIMRLFENPNHREWVKFERFKMKVYDGTREVRGSDGDIYPIEKIIKLFLRVIKAECILYCRRKIDDPRFSGENINWGVTIPAIWEEPQKEFMRKIVYNVFSNKAVLLSEPEGALISLFLSFNAVHYEKTLRLENNRTTLVADIGGGTTDIVVVKEVVSEGETLSRFEMLMVSDGLPIGGNKIDIAFWHYFASVITKDIKDADGRPYCDRINLINDLCYQFRDDDRLNWFELENNWYALKHSTFTSQRSEISLNIPREYIKWLKKNNHNNVGDKIADNYAAVVLEREKLIEEVFNPTFDKIVEKIRSCIPEDKRIDIFAIAGGLSLNSLLERKIKKAIEASGYGEEKCRFIAPRDPMFAGGGIADGAGYQLVYGRDIILRMSKRTYLYTVRGERNEISFISQIREDYLSLGMSIPVGDIQSAIRVQARYKKVDNGSFCYLLPFSIKNKSVNNYKQTLIPAFPDQTTLSLDIYSTDAPLILYPDIDGERNPDLEKESSVIIDLGYLWKSVTFEVLLNEGQVTGELQYRVTDNVTNEIKAEGKLQNAYRIGY